MKNAVGGSFPRCRSGVRDSSPAKAFQDRRIVRGPLGAPLQRNFPKVIGTLRYRLKTFRCAKFLMTTIIGFIRPNYFREPSSPKYMFKDPQNNVIALASLDMSSPHCLLAGKVPHKRPTMTSMIQGLIKVPQK
jgi:hypothetical protein